MPTRNPGKKILTPCMGEDAFIVVRPPTWSQTQAIEASRKTEDLNELGKSLSDLIIEWNWVNYDGTPLLMPSVDPTVLTGLTIDEVKDLFRAITEVVNPPEA